MTVRRSQYFKAGEEGKEGGTTVPQEPVADKPFIKPGTRNGNVVKADEEDEPEEPERTEPEEREGGEEEEEEEKKPKTVGKSETENIDGDVLAKALEDYSAVEEA